MSDMGTTDRIYVCGPGCKAIPVDRVTEGEASWWKSTSWWEKGFAAVLVVVCITLLMLGALDVGLRFAISDWTF